MRAALFRLTVLVPLTSVLPFVGGAEAKRLYCADFPTYQDAVAFCLAEFGRTVGCGGLDRDLDGLPCECNKGGPEADENACRKWREDNQ